MKYHFDQDNLVVTITGDVLSTTVDALRDSFATLIDSPTVQRSEWKVLELDLTDTKLMDSAGINLILAILKRVKAAGKIMRARISSRTIHRIFLFTRLERHMELVLKEK